MKMPMILLQILLSKPIGIIDKFSRQTPVILLGFTESPTNERSAFLEKKEKKRFFFSSE